MAEFEECNKVDGVFGGVELNSQAQQQVEPVNVFGGVQINPEPEKSLPTKVGFWSKFKAFWLQEINWNQEIKVELTPYQQKVEDEINEFLHQEVSFKRFHNFLFNKNGKNN